MEAKTAYKLWLEKESGILRTEIYKTFTMDTATAWFEEILENYSEEQRRYFCIFLGPDAQAMVGKELRVLARDKFPQLGWDKIAVYGINPGLRMVAKILMNALGKAKDTKFFTTEKESLEWLKAEIEKDKTSKKTS